jgi:hypothetical protein
MALVVFASLSFGQGFCRFMYDDAYVLTQGCEPGSPPLPDGTPVYIYWDANSNGPDAADQLACAITDCPVNYCTFALNGEALGLGAGYFITDLDFCSALCNPVPSRFYLRINCSDGTPHYVSGVHTFTPGPADEPWYDWSCFQCVPQGCTPPQPPVVNIGAAGGNQYQGISVCIPLCANGTSVITICAADGHALNPANLPVSTWHAGCLPPGCDVDCQPGEAIVTGPFYNPATGCFEYVVIGMADNTCFCFTFDHFLAVGFNNNFLPVAHSNSVAMSWSTNSESNLLRFDIVRSGEVVGHVDATNSPTGSPYTYTDNSALNGTTYSYTLRSVGMNNDGSDLQTVEGVTPSFNAAVVTQYALIQNFPNPFNPSTEIAFDVLNTNPVTLKVYNAAGQEVATLVNGANYEGGKRYVVNFDASNLTSGLYFYSVKIGSEFSATKKMLLVK